MTIITDEILQEIEVAGLVCLDIEYNPDTEIQDKGFDLWGCGCSFYLPNKKIKALWLTNREDIQKVLDFVCEKQIPITAHFAQSDYVGFLWARYTFPTDPVFHCTAIAYNFLYEEWRERELNLKKSLIPKFLNKTRAGFMECAAHGPESDIFIEYAKDDVIDQLQLYTMAEKQLKEQGLFDTYMLVTKSIVPFGDMIYEGLPFNMDNAEDLDYKFSIVEDELEKAIYAAIGPIELGSPKQLAHRLFTVMKFSTKGLEKGKTGFGTGAANIEKLAERHPECELISAWRTCAKMKSTYINPFAIQAEQYGRIYDYFFLDSRTGRTRTKRFQLMPNNLGKNIKFNKDLKNGFADLKIRSMVSAPEGKKLVVADYSSLEYRTAALAAKDEKMIKMYREYKCDECGASGETNVSLHKCPECNSSNFKHGKDLHSFIRDVCNQFGAGIDRSRAKNVSFCIVFNGTAYKLKQILGLPLDTCQKIQRSLLDELPGLETWQGETRRLVDEAYRQTTLMNKEFPCEVRDIFGRKRNANLFERLKFKSPEDHKWIKKQAANELINFVCQSPGSILCQIALRNTRKRLKNEGLWDKARIVCMVHDELLVECDEDIAEYCLELLMYEMETAVTLDVPMICEGVIVDSWDEAK